jgi:hypothetical protein
MDLKTDKKDIKVISCLENLNAQDLKRESRLYWTWIAVVAFAAFGKAIPNITREPVTIGLS